MHALNVDRVAHAPPPSRLAQESKHLGPTEALEKIKEGVEAESFIRLHVVQAVGNERERVKAKREREKEAKEKAAKELRQRVKDGYLAVTEKQLKRIVKTEIGELEGVEFMVKSQIGSVTKT